MLQIVFFTVLWFNPHWRLLAALAATLLTISVIGLAALFASPFAAGTPQEAHIDFIATIIADKAVEWAISVMSFSLIGSGIVGLKKYLAHRKSAETDSKDAMSQRKSADYDASRPKMADAPEVTSPRSGSLSERETAVAPPVKLETTERPAATWAPEQATGESEADISKRILHRLGTLNWRRGLFRVWLISAVTWWGGFACWAVFNIRMFVADPPSREFVETSAFRDSVQYKALLRIERQEWLRQEDEKRQRVAAQRREAEARLQQARKDRDLALRTGKMPDVDSIYRELQLSAPTEMDQFDAWIAQEEAKGPVIITREDERLAVWLKSPDNKLKARDSYLAQFRSWLATLVPWVAAWLFAPIAFGLTVWVLWRLSDRCIRWMLAGFSKGVG